MLTSAIFPQTLRQTITKKVDNLAADTPWTIWLVRPQFLLLAIMLLALAGHKFGLLPFQPAFYGFSLSLLLIVVAGLVALGTLLITLVTGNAAVRGFAAIALVIGLIPPAAIVAIVGPGRFSLPPIHDISTDLENPPAFIAAQAQREPGDNDLEHGGASLADTQRRAYPDIEPIFSSLPPDQAFAKSLAISEDLGWELLASDSAEGRIEAYDETRFFGFRDDVVIRITATERGSRIDLRSLSRVGQGDLGANAARIRRFRQHFLDNEKA